MFNSSFCLAVSNPAIICVSRGYHYYNDGTRVFIRIYHMPHLCMYRVKVKLPKHKTLHLLWNRAHFHFEDNDWLVFDVLATEWLTVNYNIQKVFNSIYFE